MSASLAMTRTVKRQPNSSACCPRQPFPPSHGAPPPARWPARTGP
jgi:hypothetical protein